MLKASRILGITIVLSLLLITPIACKAASTSNPIQTSGVSSLWFGTYEGVVKYDGTNWTTYNTSNSGLADDNVLTIAIDSAGNK
jgi:ligand-binding sensor domain-containing protein